MAGTGFSLTRLMTSSAAGVALAVLAGCASAPSQAQPSDETKDTPKNGVLVIPDNSRPKEAYACGEPTTTSLFATVAAAGIGHLLDKKSGGGRGHERNLGQAAHALTAPCVLKPAEAAASTPTSALSPAPVR